jgi:hypothetical protein
MHNLTSKIDKSVRRLHMHRRAQPNRRRTNATAMPQCGVEIQTVKSPTDMKSSVHETAFKEAMSV